MLCSGVGLRPGIRNGFDEMGNINGDVGGVETVLPQLQGEIMVHLTNYRAK